MYLGIDSGSTSTKLVLVGADGKILGRRVAATGLHGDEVARKLWAELSAAAGSGAGELKGAVATGYGRRSLSLAARTVTEITCHAVGVHTALPEARLVIDIGGQDSKVIRLSPGGQVEDFAMNDKCAAGTGRFLEVLAARFEMTVEELARFAGAAGEGPEPAIEINSTCTVFAETEVIGLLGEGRPRGAIIAGVHLALARRVAALAEQMGSEGPVAFSGGVALNPAMAALLARCLGGPVQVAPDPQFTAALGAALLARG
jgi:predicted CoA-substrate-specific enzyme activase